MKLACLASVIVPRPSGMLGNRLFLGAYFAANALRYGYRFYYPALGEYAEWFPATSGRVTCAFPGESQNGDCPRAEQSARFRRSLLCKTIEALTHPAFAPLWQRLGIRVLDLARTHDASDTPYRLDAPEFVKLLHGCRMVVAKGWKFRDDEALGRFHEPVRAFFSPTRAIQSEVNKVLAQAREGMNRVIGVHIRRGDYANWLGGRYFFSIERYIAWMREALSLWPGERIAFVVCSNEELHGLSGKVGARVVLGPGNAAGDLYSLAACDAILGPPSTFSLWASFHGRVPLHMLESAEQPLHRNTFTFHDRA